MSILICVQMLWLESTLIKPRGSLNKHLQTEIANFSRALLTSSYFSCVNIVWGKYLNKKMNKKMRWLEVEWKNEDSWSQLEFCHGFYWSLGLHTFYFFLNVCRELRYWILKPSSGSQLQSRKCVCVCAHLCSCVYFLLRCPVTGSALA